MLSDVQGWLDGTSLNYGWLLKSDSEALQTTFRAFYTREGAIEHGLPQYAPDLVVSCVVPAPEPPPLAMIALAGLTIILLGRRRC
jgi:MYXO-CTERM domain-containing protein